MDDQPAKRPSEGKESNEGKRMPPVPPRLSKADWQRRDRTRVTLSRSDLEQLAQLVRAGHVMLNDGRSVSPQLRAAMSRIGLATHGL